jgi:predicted N-acetyltransferase YhbS
MIDRIKITQQNIPDSIQLTIMHSLYNNCFDLLKMTERNFIDRLAKNDKNKTYFIAEIDNQIVGYSIVAGNAITLLIVSEIHRNEGIGSILLEKAEEKIKKEYDSIELVSSDYILCGVPFDTKSSYYKWFENKGFAHNWTACDMTVDLKKFSSEGVSYSSDNIVFKKLHTDDEIESCYNGADSVEKGWGRFFAEENTNAIIAIKGEEVIGGIIVSPYRCLFDESIKDAGTIGALWVLKEYRKKGMGMELYCDALIELKKEGCNICHIGYTYLESWYGKLGAKKYIDYWIGSKKI